MKPVRADATVIDMNISRRGAHALLAGALALVALTVAAQAVVASVPARLASATRRPAAQRPAAQRPAKQQLAAQPLGWRLNKIVSVRHKGVTLVGIDAVSAGDAWAAGMSVDEYGASERPLIEHWDGTAWRPVALPATAVRRFHGPYVFANVGASSAANVWAVSFEGSYLRRAGHRWTFGSLPGSNGGKLVVTSVSALSSRDVWAFGNTNIGSSSRPRFAPYAARFDGRRWTVIPVPGRGIFGPVSAISADNIWAVLDGVHPMARPFQAAKVMRWTGGAWRQVPVQPQLPRRATVTAILARSNGDVWLGGSLPNNKRGTSEMAWHWNGKTWISARPQSTATAHDYYLAGFAADAGSGDGFWALGDNVSGPERLWHNSGGRWSAPVASPWPLYQIASVPDTGSTWAIGWNAGQTKGLIALHGPVPR